MTENETLTIESTMTKNSSNYCFVNKQFCHMNEMICIWSDISRHRLLFFEGARHGSGGLHRVKETWFLSHRCYSQNFRPLAPLVCRALRMLVVVTYFSSCPVHTIDCRTLGPSCPWPFVSLICCANDVQETAQIGLGLCGYAWQMFFTSSRGNRFYMLMKNSIMNTCHVGCNGCLWQGAGAM